MQKAEIKPASDDEVAEAFLRLEAEKEHLDTATRLIVEIVESRLVSA